MVATIVRSLPKVWIAAADNEKERKQREKSASRLEINSDGHVLDFHATRHTYISALVNSGASVKVAQELARHSTPTLTIGLYAHTRRDDLSSTLESLPAITDTELRQESAQRQAQRAGRGMGLNGAIRCDEEAFSTIDEERRNSLPDKRKREALQLCATPRS